jgi:hypothetical protein
MVPPQVGAQPAAEPMTNAVVKKRWPVAAATETIDGLAMVMSMYGQACFPPAGGGGGGGGVVAGGVGVQVCDPLPPFLQSHSTAGVPLVTALAKMSTHRPDVGWLSAFVAVWVHRWLAAPEQAAMTILVPLAVPAAVVSRHRATPPTVTRISPAAVVVYRWPAPPVQVVICRAVPTVLTPPRTSRQLLECLLTSSMALNAADAGEDATTTPAAPASETAPSATTRPNRDLRGTDAAGLLIGSPWVAW